MDIFYEVITKSSTCSCCGKKIKNIYRYNDKDYGYYCFMELMGEPIDRKNNKQKPLPNWLYDLLNNYFEKVKDDTDENVISVNFFNEYITKSYPDHAVWNRTVEVQGKPVPVYQQYMLDGYLRMKLKQYINNNI